ncbi:MAG: tRNA uridine-5-carboxymethylaminomethyl(34) synthesis GTPase MnmE, partial [Alphaproteobacteria bacterium]|nr:tRNA uridine-5-carboxymethylaminomethyl(34) synthesis GTPase MnmE [Alphaproteobacteria bacterium]
MRDDTIFALSSAPGRSGVALFRVSGPQAGAAVRALTGQGPPHPRRAALRAFVDGKGRAIDHGLLLWFPGPASFTGEDCAEFHAHGGRAIAEGLMAALGAVPGLRTAEAGEFTRRAVENGKLDLTRAEALADLIDAETESQRRQALRQYGGVAEALYEDWRTRLIAAGALAEAAIDFAEEELPEDVETRARENLSVLQAEIAAHLDDARRGELIRDGVHLTVIGPPNAGKSSLINTLAKRSVAIVSDIPGTTRDVIDIRLDLGGYLVTISDTAGLRESGDTIEQEGVRRARARAAESDLVLLLLDGASSDQPELGDLKPDLIVWNKI